MIRRLRHQPISNTTVMVILMAFFVGAVVGSAGAHVRTDDPNWWVWLDGFWQNFGTEMFGAFLTFLLIEVLVGTRDEKKKLIYDMASRDNAIALRAANEIAANGWLRDGSLREANLRRAELIGADLQGADFAGVHLHSATLASADLRGADLSNGDLFGVDFSGAYLTRASLAGADMRVADLRGALMHRADLRGAVLIKANMEGARNLTVEQLRQAENLMGATLPDGTQLPSDRGWREVFEDWVSTVAARG